MSVVSAVEVTASDEMPFRCPVLKYPAQGAQACGRGAGDEITLTDPSLGSPTIYEAGCVLQTPHGVYAALLGHTGHKLLPGGPWKGLACSFTGQQSAETQGRTGEYGEGKSEVSFSSDGHVFFAEAGMTALFRVKPMRPLGIASPS